MLAALDVVDAFLQQRDAFLVGTQLYVSGPRPIVEGAKDFGLHVAHGFGHAFFTLAHGFGEAFFELAQVLLGSGCVVFRHG